VIHDLDSKQEGQGQGDGPGKWSKREGGRHVKVFYLVFTMTSQWSFYR